MDGGVQHKAVTNAKERFLFVLFLIVLFLFCFPPLPCLDVTLCLLHFRQYPPDLLKIFTFATTRGTSLICLDEPSFSPSPVGQSLLEWSPTPKRATQCLSGVELINS